jgi:ligand-binding sensor domain-containing protein
MAGLLLIVFPASGQQRIMLSAPDAYQLYPIQHINYCFGQADPSASRIMQDSYGFMWFGTVNSLISFDGYNYTTYKVSSGDSTGLTGYWVTALFEDNDKNIWAGTYGGLSRLNRKTGVFCHFYPDTTNYRGPNNVIRFIAQDKVGYIWLITNKNIFRLNPHSGKFSEFALDSLAWLQRNPEYGWAGTPVKKLFLEDHKGKIWIGTSNGLLWFDPVTGKNRMIRNIPGDSASLGHNYVTSILEDTRNNIWVSTMGGGLNLLIDENKFTFRSFRHDPDDASSICTDSILSLSLVNSGKLWIGGMGVISLMLPGQTECRSWRFNEFPAQARWHGRIHVNEVFEDHNGGIWVFHRQLGIGRLYLDIPILIFQDIGSGFQHEVCMDHAGSFWIGTIDNYAFRIDLQAPRIIHCRYDFVRPWILEDRSGILWVPNNNLKLNSVGGIREITRAQLPGNVSFTAMYEDPEGYLWFANNSIQRYNPGSRSIFTFRLSGTVYEKTKISGIKYLQGDQNGNLWFGNRDFLAFLNTETRQSELVSPRNFKFMVENDWQVEQILIDSHNTVWIATLEGICSIEPDHGKRFTRFTFNPSKSGTLGDNAAFRLAEDTIGRIWVLTLGSGLFLFNRDSGTFQRLNLFQDIPYISFHEMIADLKGNLWIFHTAGVSCFSTIDRSIRHFSFPKRTLDVTLNQISNGNIYIVPRGEEGTYIINPDSIQTNGFIPPVYITSMLVNHKPYPNILNQQNTSGANIIRLKHRENSVTFSFSALNYTEPENNQYKYRMIGMEEDTTLAGTNHTVEYRNMRPGKYYFWVSGSNNDGLWNPAGTLVSFIIRPPWFRSLTAWLIYGSICLHKMAHKTTGY